MLWAEFSPLSKSQGNVALLLLLVVSPVAGPFWATQGSRIVHTPVCLSVCLSIYLSVHLSVCPSILPSVRHLLSTPIAFVLY